MACRIVVQGVLSGELSDRLAGLSIDVGPGEHEGSATTLVGRLSDQAQLIGVLNALYELRHPILAVLASPLDRSSDPQA